ncbi:PAS domain S-box protein [bacterium]|nr:PAS domain S-box protein [bacterium]
MKEKARILIVEDEHIVAEDIRRSLLNLGYDVIAIASSGRDALNIVRKLEPDLIMMDIVIKGRMTGIEVTRKIRSEYNIPVVYLTAYADLQTLDQAKSTDPFGYMIKPFNERELQSTVEMALYKHAMEKKLRDSEAWFSTTLGSMVDSVIATNDVSEIIFFNRAAEQLIGVSTDAAIGRQLTDVVSLHDETSGEGLDLLPDVAGKGGVVRSVDGDTILITHAGQRISVDESAAPIRNQHGDVLGTVLVIKDITARRKALDLAQEERDFINTLLHVSPSFYVAIDVEGRILMMNHAICQALGYSMKEVLGKAFVPDFIAEDTHGITFKRMMETHEPFDGEARVLTRDGRERLVSWHGKSVLKKYGEFDFYFVMGIDITARRQTENALRYSEERYRGLFETMAQGVVYYNKTGRIIASNPAAEVILGRHLTQMVGLSVLDSCWDIITEDGTSISKTQHPVIKALNLQLPQQDVVLGLLTPEYKRKWLLMDATPVGAGQIEQRFGAVFTTFTDISQRKEMELEISNRNYQLKSLNDLARRVSGSLELQPIGEAALDEVLRLTEYAAGVLYLFDHRKGSEGFIIQKGLEGEMSTKFIQRSKDSGSILFRLIRAGEIAVLTPKDLGIVIRFDPELASFSGKPHGLIVPLKEGARVIGTLIFFDEISKFSTGTDIAFLIQVGHHIGLAVHNGRLYREAHLALKKLEITQEKLVESEKLAGLGAMASNVVHEIGNPLAAISNSIQVLQGRLQLEGRMKELLDIIGWETERLERSVNELREFSKPKRLQFAECDIADVIRKAVFILDQDVELTFGRKIVRKIGSRLPLISIDPDAIEQVVMNLIKNSLQAVHEGGFVEVHLKREGRKTHSAILIEIKDNGPGIANENLERIFEPYFSTKVRGMGLGMHIVKTHVEAHGGYLTIQSEESKGTCVQVHLPLFRGDND